ncbi:MAG: Xaa-Pro peptidase family protein [Bryobacterales bacterium]
MTDKRYFPAEEYARRLDNVRAAIDQRGLKGCLVSRPENIYYLTGLNYQGYFAYQMLVVPLEGAPVLVTRAMERATVRDQTPDVRHMGYSDGIEPLPPPADRSQDVQLEKGQNAGLEPWSMSLGVRTAKEEGLAADVSPQARTTCEAIGVAGLSDAKLGVEMDSLLFPVNIAREIFERLPQAEIVDASGLIDGVRVIQSPAEQACTRRAASMSDAMMRAAIVSAGPGINEQTVMRWIYDAMFQSGSTYPAFLPLVRSTRTLDHEHGTWNDNLLLNGDYLFLELSGCWWRYHAPIGRLIFIGRAPEGAERINAVCCDAIDSAAQRIGPGVKAREVYQAWQESVNKAGMQHYRRHHCGYAVGIGFPPSWSGGGVPVGLRSDSDMELKPGMVFHLMSWLLRTGKGDSFISDTALVTENGCEILTTTSRMLTVK